MIRLATMAALRISSYLKEEGVTEYWIKYPRLLDCEAEKEEVKAIEKEYFESMAMEKNNSMEKLYHLLSPTDKEDSLPGAVWSLQYFII